MATRRSLLLAGSARPGRRLDTTNLIKKTVVRPDLTRPVIRRVHADNGRSTVTTVRGRLGDDTLLGYGAAGVAAAVGSVVDGVRPGMRVATASVGQGEYHVVPGLLTVPVPDSVTDQAAAFGAVAGVALQGIRQADVGVGGSVAVVGLGLLGQLTVRLALAAGLNAVGIDLRDWAAELVDEAGALGLVEGGGATTERIMELTRGRGVDAVVITASMRSSEPVSRAAEMVRDRGIVVVVGDVGLDLDRRMLHEQEIELRFARGFGAGRHDRSYEEWGVDYPVGHVRWTGGRNIEAYLDLVARGQLVVEDLVTHVFPVEDAMTAYDTATSDERALAVQLSFAAPPQVRSSPVMLRSRPTTPSGLRAGLVGAGAHARTTLLPALKAAGWADDLVAVTSARGLSARELAERNGIGLIVPTAEDLLALDDIDVVFILSSHDSHAGLVVKALDARKHVFVEKPLALSQDEFDAVRATYDRGGSELFVGFNRRYSAAAVRVREMLAAGSGPVSICYRVNAGRLPDTHWYRDRRQGGRILGEVCQFIDLASWLISAQPTSVDACRSGRGELSLEEDVAVLLGYPDGSIATITYITGGHGGTPTERVEILGRGRTMVIDNFRRLGLDGRVVRGVRADMGHRSQLTLVRKVLRRELRDVESLAASYGTTEAALRVVAALEGSGRTGTSAPPAVTAQATGGVRQGSTLAADTVRLDGGAGVRL